MTIARLRWWRHDEPARPRCDRLWDDEVPGTAASAHRGPVELGVRFRTEVDGEITAIRFFKGRGNTGRHVGTIWSATGDRLGATAFRAERGTGWQHATFDPPVPLCADTTYVASYFAPRGRFAKDAYWFTESDRAGGAVRALLDGEDGPNGVRLVGGPGFPDEPHRATNYWIDVDFVPSAEPNGSRAAVVDRRPGRAATLVPTHTTVAVRFTSPVELETTTVELRDRRGASVALSCRIDDDGCGVVATPTRTLEHHTAHTVLVDGASLRSPSTWTFVTAPRRPEPVRRAAPDAPVLVVGTEGFARYVPELLLADGIPAVGVVADLDPSRLPPTTVVVLAGPAVTDDEAAALERWVLDGGRLVAIRPPASLADLVGLHGATIQVDGGQLVVDTATAPGAGIHDGPIRLHGPVDVHERVDARVVASRRAGRGDGRRTAAVTWRDVGEHGGVAAALTFDLARAVVLTRQGNPDWVDQRRTGSAPCRPSDLFFGAAGDDPQPDWVDVDSLDVPHADELRLVLTNLLVAMTSDRLPLPRLAALPAGAPAVVVMTGDSHARGNGTPRHFDEFGRADPPVRATSYIVAGEPMTDAEAAAYEDAGFEIALHVSPNRAGDFTAAHLRDALATQLGAFATAYPSLRSPTTNRNHAVAWSGWTTVPEGLREHGIRLDTTYYHHPAAWIGDRPGFLTGSATPMRYADADGAPIDVYQAATQLTDESGLSYPAAVDALLDAAVGPSRRGGAFVVNLHTDHFPNGNGYENAPALVVASARARGIAVISARMLLAWLDARESCVVTGLAATGGRLRFDVTVGVPHDGLVLQVPALGLGGRLATVTVDGVEVAHRWDTLKGAEHAIVPARTGAYEVTFEGSSR